MAGVIHSLQPGSVSCNATVTPVNIWPTCVTVKDLLHVDDLHELPPKAEAAPVA